MNYLSQRFKFRLIFMRPFLTGLFISIFCLLMSFHPVSAQNYSLTFDGSNDYVSFSQTPAFNSTTTIEAWIKIVIPTGYAIAEPNIVSWGADANSVEFRLGISGNTATLQFGIDATGSGGGAWQAIYGSTNINTGNWVHVAVVKNGNTSTLFINGVSETSGTISRSPSLNTCDIGNLNEHGGQQTRYFPGLIDEVRIWNTARTQAEIQANMYKELAGTESGLTNYYKMTNGSGTTLTDNKGSSTGTISGATWIQPDAFPVDVFVSDTYAAGYKNIKSAFDAINAGTHTGAITIKLNDNSNESASAVLNASGTGGSSYTSVNIYPTTTGLSISGNIGNYPLIDLNGADNVTIDGRVNAGGSSISLVISNTSTSSSNFTSTIRFTNDATYNNIKYCKLQGSTTAGDQGILSFYRGAITSGNSYNTIDHNEITNAGGNRPRNALFSFGKSEAVPNSSNTVSNNNIYDVLNLSQNYTKAIALYTSEDAHPNNSYNTGWTISGNSFFDTQDLSTAGSSGDVKVIFVWADQGSGFTISNNYIGGSAALCSGTWTKATGNNQFLAIWINAKQGGATNYLQGNTIKNFSLINSGASSWYGIYFNGGDNNVSNNCIGATTGTGSIIFTNGSTGGSFVGYNQGVYCSSTCSNNTIGSITVANSNGANATNFLGIWVNSSCGSATNSNNLVGSTTTPNSINATSASTSNAQTMVGIRIQGSSTLNIANNTVANLTNGTTNTTTSTQGYIYGIYPFQGVNTITGNTVHDLTIANANDGTGPAISTGEPSTSLSAGGIVAPIYNGNNQTISNNTVYNISNSYSSFTGHVAGIYHYGQSSASSVNSNFIYGLGVSSSSSSASIYGIKIAHGATTYSNNIITLGDNTTANLYGIYESGAAYTTSYIYFNTVYMAGSPTSGSINSACLYNADNSGDHSARDFRNNIFFNARSNNGSSGKNYAMYIKNTGGGLTCDFNDYYASGTGGKLGYYFLGDKTALPIVTGVTGNDAHSKNTDPGFASATPGATAADYLPSVTSLIAATGTSITTDYDGGADRSGTLPAMGAFEYAVSTCTAPAITSQSTATQTQCISGTFNPITVTATGDGLSYQWYSNGTADTFGGTSLVAANGAQTNSYTPQSGTAGTFYYYCIVTGTCGTATSAVSGAFIVNAPSFTPAVRHVSDLTATGQNIKWYAAASGGSALTSTDVLPTGTTHYFASQTVNNVESTARLDVTATILSTPCVPTGTAIQTYSAGSTVASLQATGSGIRWYAAESGGAALATSTALVNGVHYWATQTVSCTESATRLEVIVTIN